jgi:hypothetical protein
LLTVVRAQEEVVELKDVAVTSFNFYPRLKGPVVQAIVQFTFDEFDTPQITSIDLTPEEREIVLIAARTVEDRFLSKETPIPEEVKSPLGFIRFVDKD